MSVPSKRSEPAPSEGSSRRTVAVGDWEYFYVEREKIAQVNLTQRSLHSHALFDQGTINGRGSRALAPNISPLKIS